MRSLRHPHHRPISHHVKAVLEVLLMPLKLGHLICLIVGPFLGLACLSWLVAGWLWSADPAQNWLQESSILPTPWKSNIWTFVALYGSILWIAYIWPTAESPKGRVRMQGAKNSPMQAVWKRIAPWGLVFGVLAYLSASYVDLTWPWWGFIVAGMIWVLSEEVWTLRRLMG